MFDTFADRLALVVALSAAAFATSVAAAPPPGGSEALRSGAPTPARIIDGRVWTCTETACRAAASSTADSQPATRECARVAAALGPFTSYATGDRALTAAEMERCNARAPSPAPVVAAAATH